MIAYKERYEKVKGQLERLQSNCIDLRTIKKDQRLIFSKKFGWVLVEDTEDRIILTKP